MGDGTGCDNMTAVIAKMKPEAFKDQKSVSDKVKTEAATEAGNGKRPHDDEENKSESCPEAKKAKTENSEDDSKPETKSD